MKKLFGLQGGLKSHVKIFGKAALQLQKVCWKKQPYTAIIPNIY